MRRLHRAAAPLATLTVCLSLGLSAVPPAVGDPGAGATSGTGSALADPAVPSHGDVRRARERATRTAGEVSAIKARLLLATQRLEQASVRAEQAAEAYNGARWRLQQAGQAYRTARAEAARSRRTVVGQRDRIGALVAQSYQQGGDLSALTAVVSADGPEGVLDQYAAFQGASTSLQADYQRYAASDALATVFERRARQAQAEQGRRAELAHTAQQQAAAAEVTAQGQAGAVAAEKNRLVRELARVQHISVTLARTRQAALEEIARKRAEERARRVALAAAQAEQAAQAARARAAADAAATAAAKPKAVARRSAPAASSRPAASRGGRATHPGPAPAPRAPAPPAPAPAPTPPAPAPAGGAERAVAFAEAQLGDPYVWAAAGPNAWDCSGLTMGAWAAAGRSLPHYSVAQYEASTPISASQLRAGDLVFWTTNGRASGIHHVAMYLGNGQIIHAPRTGRPVEIDSMYYWIPPTLFARV